MKKVSLAIGIILLSGCSLIEKKHFQYDKQAFDLVAPLAVKELKDQRAADEISDQQLEERLGAITKWGEVVEDNLKD